MSSLGEQTWFRSGDRSLEGWVHRPDDGHAVGTVVIAGPFAHEALVTYRASRVLAVEAARRGFVAVRFSWSGTGDSEPAPEQADLATAWQEDLAAATELARVSSGIEQVDAIGIRFGAAVVAAADIPLHKRVLWEPLGGRAFLRMQSSLLKMQLPVGFPLSADRVELCGYTLDENAALSLRAVSDPRSAGSGDAMDASRVIIEDDPQASADLFDRSPQDARVPFGTIARILDALDPMPAAALPGWDPQRELVSVDLDSGRRIRQTLLTVGPDQLPGIFTEPVEGPSASTAALFVTFANDPKGMGRIGRATAFRLGGGGIPTLRADRRGIGDGADPRDLGEGPTLVEAGGDDIAQFARWLAERTGKAIVGIGLCSGAWLIARAATATPFQRVIMVNNKAWTASRRYWDRQLRVLSGLRRMGVVDSDIDVDTMSPTTAGFKRRLKLLLRFRSPYQIRYRIFSPLGLDEVPEMLLRQMPEQTSISVLLGPGGDQQHWEASRGPVSMRRLIRRGRRIDIEYDPRTDHSLMSASGFESYLELLDREFGLRVPTAPADATLA
ncbi:hypothetical protein ACFPJ4_01010 [Lysinimonas soli]|uniref:Alpha/beta hydrolase n=1 Tax=Lysinimonas soli TaxID=1074233 RepID=A0ABW0NN45_9MICO